jgi:hypothetical protein
MYPIKDYEDLSRRWRKSFSYPFVRETFNYSMAELATHTELLLGGDARGRYTEYTAMLKRIFMELSAAGVRDILDLTSQIETRMQLEIFEANRRVRAVDIVAALKYLIYWFVPMEKPLGSLVRADPAMDNAVKALRELGVRTNLELLQQGITASGRKALAETSGLEAAVIAELVHRADFSRMPWASKATISNLIGAGYGSLAQLAAADPERLYADFFGYGEAIGKNLKLGNEIENSYRIAQIVPVLLRADS